MRRFVPVAAIVGAIAALLVGGWLLLGGRDQDADASRPAGAAPTTRLPPVIYSSDRQTAPQPFPMVPDAQVTGDRPQGSIRLGADGRQLLVPLLDGECTSQEAKLIGEHDDRIEVVIHPLPRPAPATPPPGVTPRPDGSYSYGCVTLAQPDGPYAVIDLGAPLGTRNIQVRYQYQR